MTFECSKVALQSPERRLCDFGVVTRFREFPHALTLPFNERCSFGNVVFSLS